MTSPGAILGAHISTQGGLATAFARAEADGCDCFQIFTKNRGMGREALVKGRSRVPEQAGPPRIPVIFLPPYLLNIARR